MEEPAKHEVEEETILIPVLSEDITEKAVKVLEETPKVLNTAKLEEGTTKAQGETCSLQTCGPRPCSQSCQVWKTWRPAPLDAKVLKGTHDMEEAKDLAAIFREETTELEKTPELEETSRMEEAKDLAAILREETTKLEEGTTKA